MPCMHSKTEHRSGPAGTTPGAASAQAANPSTGMATSPTPAVQEPARRPEAGTTASKSRLRPANKGPRIRRERRLLAAMIGIWCQDQHTRAAPGSGAGRKSAILCNDCTSLLRYGQQRLDHCALGECKRPCADCTSDCYSEAMRPRMLEITRYAEPRLLSRHPLLGLRHRLDQLFNRLRSGTGRR